MLELIDVTIDRGPTRVVRGLTLRLEPGRVFWVVGPNGAGKSSLLRVLAGLDRPTAGRVLDRHSAGTPPLYYHSEMRIPGSATAADWERLAKRLLPATPDPTPIRPALAGRRRLGRLSTGERKRLLLDVLLRKAGPLLLDEPFEHLSPGAKESLGHRLEERARSSLVVVATNQATHRVRDGLRLESGEAVPLSPASTAERSGAEAWS